MTASNPRAKKLIDGDEWDTCIHDLSIYGGNETWLNIEHYNDTWYLNAVPIGLVFESDVECNMVQVMEKVFFE